MLIYPKILALLFVITLTQPLFAQGPGCRIPTVVYFGNGIGSGITTLNNAHKTLDSLEVEVNKTLTSSEQS